FGFQRLRSADRMPQHFGSYAKPSRVTAHCGVHLFQQPAVPIEHGNEVFQNGSRAVVVWIDVCRPGKDVDAAVLSDIQIVVGA
ncbi:hypothetical protein L9G16_23020, partial [Shewanella sp. A25]|nr:hypothetical protein [Shewanella shenzhenensis]